MLRLCAASVVAEPIWGLGDESAGAAELAGSLRGSTDCRMDDDSGGGAGSGEVKRSTAGRGDNSGKDGDGTAGADKLAVEVESESGAGSCFSSRLTVEIGGPARRAEEMGCGDLASGRIATDRPGTTGASCAGPIVGADSGFGAASAGSITIAGGVTGEGGGTIAWA